MHQRFLSVRMKMSPSDTANEAFIGSPRSMYDPPIATRKRLFWWQSPDFDIAIPNFLAMVLQANVSATRFAELRIRCVLTGCDKVCKRRIVELVLQYPPAVEPMLYMITLHQEPALIVLAGRHEHLVRCRKHRINRSHLLITVGIAVVDIVQ